MLSSVLRSPRAVQVNIAIMRAFVRQGPLFPVATAGVSQFRNPHPVQYPIALERSWAQASSPFCDCGPPAVAEATKNHTR